MPGPYSSLSFADFSARASSLTIAQLRDGAKEEFGVEIPSSVTRKSDVLKAVFGAGGGTHEPEGAPPEPLTAPGADAYRAEAEIEETPPEGDKLRYKMLCRVTGGAWRCGKKWPKGYSDFNPDEWTEEQLARFETDKRLSIKKLR